MSRLGTQATNPNALVEEYIAAFDAPRGEAHWIAEVNHEIMTYEEELARVLERAVDVLYAFSGLAVAAPQSKVDADTIARVKTITKTARRLFGDAEFQEAFRRVHASRMSSLGPNGQPLRDETGGVIPGPNYRRASLNDLA